MPILSDLRLTYYIEEVRNSDNAVLEYNREHDQLQLWAWPASGNSRVRPSELRDYRESHRMLGPCCLCPMIDGNGPDYVESAMYQVALGLFRGEYVASCARERCGYVAFLERLYDKGGVPIKKYPQREFGERVPPKVKHLFEDFPSPLLNNGRGLKRTYAMMDVTQDSIPLYRTPSRPANFQTVSALLQQLDSREQAGITKAEFNRIVAECESCGLIMTKRVFRDHVCRTDVIDLTNAD